MNSTADSTGDGLELHVDCQIESVQTACLALRALHVRFNHISFGVLLSAAEPDLFAQIRRPRFKAICGSNWTVGGPDSEERLAPSTHPLIHSSSKSKSSPACVFRDLL